MDKKIYGLALAAFLAFGMVASGAYAGSGMDKGGFMSFDSRDLIGAVVRDPQGEVVGLVSQVRVDTGGHAFAVLNHGSDNTTGKVEGILLCRLRHCRSRSRWPGR